MKTWKFRLVRAISTLLVITTVICNFIYIGHFIWNYKLFEIEKILMFEKNWSVRSFSLYLVYFNLLSAFLFGYSFNIGSKPMLKITSWLSIAANGFGVFSCVYLKLYAADTLQVALQTNMFSTGNANLSIFERYPGLGLSEIQKNFIAEHAQIASHYLIFEIINIGSLLTMTTCSFIAQFIKIHNEEEYTQRIENSTAGSSSFSLRPAGMMFRVPA